jgi:carboxyl-terminal processing protease
MSDSSTATNHYKQSIVLGILIGISIALVFTAGFLFHEIIGPQSVFAASGNSTETKGYPLLDEVQALLDQHFLRAQPDATVLQYAAIRGVLGALNDRYTFFIEPPVAQSESDVLAGTYGGIGVLLQRSELGDFVLSPFPDSPAIKAGVRDGDILRAVNDTPMSLDQQQDAIDQMLRGEVKPGNGVEIIIYRPSSDEEFTVFIEFGVINVPSVLWRVLNEDSRLGYIQILNFTNRTPTELATAIEELQTLGIVALILDLRNNRGGLLQESIQVTGEFIDSGEVVVYEKSATTEKTFSTESGGHALELPLVVLVNSNTASAAELVAAAIRDHERGFIIGQTTYGKGTVQQIFRLSDGSSVHITSAEFFTPNRFALEGKGLEPDISMIPDPNGRDVEIGEAIRYLQGNLELQGS